MTRISTRSRLLRILLALVTASAVLIAIGGSEASANPQGKIYTATIDPAAATAGVLVELSLTVTNDSDTTPLGAVNLTIPDAFRFEPVSLGSITATGDKSWSSNVSADGFAIELRADRSSDRLARYESVTVTFSVTGLQEFVDPINGYEIYAFPIDARQANTFSGEPGNGLTYIGTNAAGPEIQLNGVASRCTIDDCDLTQGLGEGTEATFTLIGTCGEVNLRDEIDGRDRIDEGCGIIAIENVFEEEEGAISPNAVVYTPAMGSTDVRAYVTLPKDELTKAASQYTFTLDLLKGELPFTVEKCHRDDLNCLEKIERTKTDVTWIFRVASEDPRMSW